MMLAFAITCAFGAAACGNGESEGSGNKGEPEHTEHAFDRKVTDVKYLKSSATCEQKAVYYYSCQCGEKGEETFEAGELKAHQFGNYIYNNDATCKRGGTETGKCSVCNVTDTRPSDVKEKHNYKNEVCSVCGEHEPTAGLEYTLSSDGDYYICSGIGTSNETVIYIADEYNDKPVEVIESRAFDSSASYKCSRLTSVYIPDSITAIGWNAFYGNNLTSIAVAEGNKKYHSKDNCIIETESKRLTVGCKNSVIPADGSVTAIGEYAFGGSGLTEIVIPDSITEIGSCAFHYCINLTDIVIPDSVTIVWGEVFKFCSSLTIYCEAESYSSWWNRDWNSSNCPVVWNCKNNDAADDGNIYTVSNGLRYAIKDGTATVIEQAKNISGQIAIPSSVEYKGSSYSVTSVGGSAFYNCGGLTGIVIPESVTSIGDSAFSGCRGLTIYSEATSVPGGWSNLDCPLVWNCKNNDVADDGYIYTVVDGIRYALKGVMAAVATQPLNISGEITIPSSVMYKGISYIVNSIVDLAFVECSDLTGIDIPAGVISIGERVFLYCKNLTSITVAEGNVNYYGKGNCIIEKASGTLIMGCSNSVIPADGSVTSIGSNAFFACGLTSVIIPDGVISIGELAFYSCGSLTSIVIPKSVTYIGSNAFHYCYDLTIYSEAESQPSSWHFNWNYSNCPVVWGYKGN